MNKKAMVGYVITIIGFTLAAILLAYLFIPQVQMTTQAQEYSENLEVHNAENQTSTLTQSSLESGSLVISGLTTPANYSVSYTTGVVTFVNGTVADNYTGVYNYYASNYLTSGSERALMGVLILIGLMGFAYAIAQGFGMV